MKRLSDGLDLQKLTSESSEEEKQHIYIYAYAEMEDNSGHLRSVHAYGFQNLCQPQLSFVVSESRLCSCPPRHRAWQIQKEPRYTTESQLLPSIFGADTSGSD